MVGEGEVKLVQQLTDTRPRCQRSQNIDLLSVNGDFYFALFRWNQSIYFRPPTVKEGEHGAPQVWVISPLSNRIFTMTFTVTLHATQ
jgi:hypothetical protein